MTTKQSWKPVAAATLLVLAHLACTSVARAGDEPGAYGPSDPSSTRDRVIQRQLPAPPGTSSTMPACSANPQPTPQTPAAAGVQVELSPDAVEARFGEETLRLSGSPTGPAAMALLRTRLERWAPADSSAPPLSVTCRAGVTPQTVQAVLDAAPRYRRVEVKLVEEQVLNFGFGDR
jgi:hypothetical protein